jgi:hypothetical protein
MGIHIANPSQQFLASYVHLAREKEVSKLEVEWLVGGMPQNHRGTAKELVEKVLETCEVVGHQKEVAAVVKRQIGSPASVAPELDAFGQKHLVLVEDLRTLRSQSFWSLWQQRQSPQEQLLHVEQQQHLKFHHGPQVSELAFSPQF